VRRAWALGALLVAVLAAAGALALAAAPASTPDRPIVLAAASLSEVLPRLEPEGRYSFAGSNQLAQQIRLGAPFDVFLSASPRYTGELSREGLVRTPVTFATNSLVLIVPRANPQRIRGVRDLARRPKLRLVVAGPTVPIGLYTRAVLKRLGLLGVLRRAVSLEPDVKGVVGKIALGEADAGFVYATDARTAGRRVEAVALPASAQPAVRYEAAIATSPQSLEAAQAFLRALRGPDGRRALRAAGFGTP
jgi:molybdate transport system substrate-binding protein